MTTFFVSAFSMAIALLAPPVTDTGWPQNLNWRALVFNPTYPVREIDPVKAELQDPRSTGALRADEMNVKLAIDGYTLSTSPDRFRLARFSTTTNLFTSVPEPPVNVRSLYGKTNEVAIEVPRDLVSCPKGERIALFVLVTRSGSGPYWLAFARSFKEPPSLGPSVAPPSLSPSISPSQVLLDGRKEFVGRAKIQAAVRDLLPNKTGTWTDLVLAGTISTDRLDPAAAGSLELQVGRKYGAHDLSHLELHVGFKSNQSGRAYGSYANITLNQFIPAKALHRASRTIETDDYAIVSLAAFAEQRWKRESDFTPYHVSPSLGYGRAELQTGAIWLFPRTPGQGNFKTDFALLFDLRGYFFPNDESQQGFASRKFESYAEVDLSLPLKLVLWVPGFYLRTGAMEGQQFSRSVQWGLLLSQRF